NVASGDCGTGGAIASFAGGRLKISNTTLNGNSARLSSGGVYGLDPEYFQNSILAFNVPSNCGDAMMSDGYNMSSDVTCKFHRNGDRNNTDPKLGKLGNYGGPTQTIPLLLGSPAIDAGNPRGCRDGQGHLLKTDQRGKPRPDHEDSGGCDMGAYERQKD